MTRPLLLSLGALCAAAIASPLIPEPVDDQHWKRTVAQHQGLLARSRPLEVVFIGDSITEGWKHAGAGVFALDFHDLKTLNLGIGGDRTEHILHRVAGYDFSRAKPKLFVLLAGTNNLGQAKPDSPEAVATAVVTIAKRLRSTSPTSKVLVVSILPSGRVGSTELRNLIKETNTALTEQLSKTKIAFINIHKQFLTPDGTWKRGHATDGTHLSETGYNTFSTHLKPKIDSLFKATAD